jgi:fibronectin type 3 domain-containing protein
MKKILVATLLASLTLAPLSYATSGDSGYTDDASKAPTLTADLSESGGVDLNWDEATDEGFVYYKVLRSQDNPDMVYPDDGYIAYITEVSDTHYYDTEFPSGTNYYRLCSIFDGNVRGCSNTVTMELTATDEEAEESEDPTYTDDNSFASTLSVDLSDGFPAFTWTEYTGDNFQWYKLVKSQETETPNYPENELVVYFDDSTELAYSDAHIEDGTTYYRLCTITTDNLRACSNTISVENGEAEDTEEAETTSEYTDDETLAPTLSYEMTEEGKVALSWTKAEEEGFVYYKVLRSNDNPDMVYPDDGYIAYISDLNTTTYTDGEFVDGTNYYRVCSVFDNKVRGCSNTLTLEELEAEIVETKTETAETSYEDIADHWAKAYIERLAAKGIVDGSKANFNPNKPITRAEAVKVIILSAGLESAECDSEIFPDLGENDWFCGVATRAYKEGYLKGENGQLQPNKPITRAQAIKLVLMAKEIAVDTEVESSFPDVADTDWFAGYVMKAKKLGIMEGKKMDDGTYKFDPNSPITRAELIKIIDKTFF